MGFRIAEAYVEIKANAAGLREDVDKDVKEAGLGQNIKVGVKVDNDRGLTLFDSLLKKVTTSAKDMALSLVKGVSSVGAVGSTALTVAPAVASAVKWVVDLGSASLQASPALLAIATSGALVKLTMDQIGPAIVKQLSPITDGFKSAGTQASALATKGVRPLAAEFDRLGMPIIASGMDKIAVATNGVVTRFLDWAKSTPGIQALRNVVDATGSAVQQLGPHISRLLESFGNMIGRIAGVSLAAGTNGLSGVLDRLSGWLDRINAATVQHGLDDLKEKYNQVRDAIERAIGWIRQAIDFWHQHRDAIKAVQDALSILAIAFGGPVSAAVAAVGLIIRHWDELKAAWKSLSDYFTQNPAGVQAANAMSSAWQTVKPALLGFWQELKDKVGPVVSEIWGKIQNQLIPAVGNLINAVAPFAAAWLNAFGPTIVAVVKGLGQAVSGLVDVVTGGIKVVTAMLTGDWRTAWDGAKQMTSGAGQIIQGAWTATAENVVATAGRLSSGVNANLDSIPRTHTTNITAVDNASAVAQQVAMRMSYIPQSVTTVITAIQRTVQGNAAGAIIGMAPGGTLTPMSGRNATIVAPDTWRVIGDRVTDDEAFIPLNHSKRSTSILAEAAQRMGFGLVKQEAGAQASGATTNPPVRGRGGRGGGPVTINVIQQSGSPAETGRMVALALRMAG